ncbi:MAG: ATP-binding protein [Lachnospiraceae bacterium]|nr:ATP-binding protein [Lachnospiraceae bacterium]
MPLQNSQYDTIMREYNRKQLMHRHILEEHKQEVYQKIPRLREIEREITAVSLQAIRRRLGNSRTSASFAYKQEIAALAQERRQLLWANGYPEDYLSMQYDCPTCQDTGYVDGQKCQCFRKAAVDLLYKQSNLEEILKKENFDSFSFSFYSDTIRNEATGLTARETAEDAVAKARQFINNFDRRFQNLFLYGNTGVGKTFLSHCIAKELIDQAHCVIYFSAFDLFDKLAKNTFRRESGIADTQNDILECDLLIIDDLGTELTNSFVASALFQCINERIMRKKSTIISTNLSLDQFSDTYSERIFSRITSHYTMIKLIGNDIRIQKRLLGGKQ